MIDLICGSPQWEPGRTEPSGACVNHDKQPLTE